MFLTTNWWLTYLQLALALWTCELVTDNIILWKWIFEGQTTSRITVHTSITVHRMSLLWQWRILRPCIARPDLALSMSGGYWRFQIDNTKRYCAATAASCYCTATAGWCCVANASAAASATSSSCVGWVIVCAPGSGPAFPVPVVIVLLVLVVVLRSSRYVCVFFNYFSILFTRSSYQKSTWALHTNLGRRKHVEELASCSILFHQSMVP